MDAGKSERTHLLGGTHQLILTVFAIPGIFLCGAPNPAAAELAILVEE
jgi:hypothetical protein